MDHRYYNKPEEMPKFCLMLPFYFLILVDSESGIGASIQRLQQIYLV